MKTTSTVRATASVIGILPVLVEPCQQLGLSYGVGPIMYSFQGPGSTVLVLFIVQNAERNPEPGTWTVEPCYVVLQGAGDHFAPSGSFLKCELVTNGWAR